MLSAPVAEQMIFRGGKPVISTSPGRGGDARIRVRHREYIQDILGSVLFANVAFAVNPGIATTFPWLSQLAGLYESYEFKKLEFEFETQKSTNTDGSLLMAIDYDASDVAPTNKTTIMSFHDAVRSPVYAEAAFRGDSQDLQKFGPRRFVRQGALAANQSIVDYDVGTLNVATQGCLNASAIGELYVVYDVEFETPQLASNQSANSNSALIVTTVASRAAPFTGTQSQTGGLPVSATGATVTFNKTGRYLLTNVIVGTAITDVAPTLTGTATASNSPNVMFHTTAATQGVDQVIVTVLNPGDTVIFDYTASATTITSSTVRIASYDASLG